jgi:hypothetical protein
MKKQHRIDCNHACDDGRYLLVALRLYDADAEHCQDPKKS